MPLLVTLGLVALNLVILAVAGIVVNKVAFKGEQTAFIMELPLYHVPNARTVGLYVWNNTASFLKKAGTFILLASAVVWALSNLPGGDVETSFLASAGRALEPVGGLMGLTDWRMIVALLSSFFAKENTIATLGVLFGAPGAGIGAGSAGRGGHGPRRAPRLSGGRHAVHPVPGDRGHDQAGDRISGGGLRRASACCWRSRSALAC